MIILSKNLTQHEALRQLLELMEEKKKAVVVKKRSKYGSNEFFYEKFEDYSNTYMVILL